MFRSLDSYIGVAFTVISFNYVLMAPNSSSLLQSLNNTSSIISMSHNMNITLVDGNNTTVSETEAKSRNKRQASAGAGKFTEAAKSPQIKVFRTYLQGIANMFSKAPVGGKHPFHPETIKPVVQLYKHRIENFFFPKLGGMEE